MRSNSIMVILRRSNRAEHHTTHLILPSLWQHAFVTTSWLWEPDAIPKWKWLKWLNVCNKSPQIYLTSHVLPTSSVGWGHGKQHAGPSCGKVPTEKSIWIVQIVSKNLPQTGCVHLLPYPGRPKLTNIQDSTFLGMWADMRGTRKRMVHAKKTFFSATPP